jgi:hypothetical protein
MARDTITVQSMVGTKNPAMLDYGTADTWAPANDIEFAFTGGEIVIINNVTASPAVVGIVAVADNQGRLLAGGLTVAAGDYGVIGPLSQEGWRQTDGMIYVDCDQAVEVLVLRPPA